MPPEDLDPKLKYPTDQKKTSNGTCPIEEERGVAAEEEEVDASEDSSLVVERVGGG